MRVECESCGELGEASFALDGDAIHATCPACHQVTTARSGPRPVVEDAAPGCAKCGAALRPGAAACGACGLAVARMAAYRDARDAAVAEPVRAAWQRADEAWPDDARHDELFQPAARHNAYAWTAARYRGRGKDPVARRQLDRLRRAAEATLLAGASARPDSTTKPYRATAGVLVALLVVVAGGLLYATVIKDRRTGARSHPAPSSEPADPAGPTAGPPGSRAPDGTIRPLVPGHPVSSSTIK